MTTNTTINYAKLADDAADTYTSARDALNRAMLHDLISRWNDACSVACHPAVHYQPSVIRLPWPTKTVLVLRRTK